VPAPPAEAPLPMVVSAPPPPPAAAPASAPERALRFGELSAEQQRQMPALLPSGYVWSEQAASRFVVLNGQLMREGDTVAPGLVLERLLPKAAQLRWRGMLIELPL
jgi:general secretion pathway protein B